MTALDTLIAEIRRRHPPTPDLLIRIARGRSKSTAPVEPAGEEAVARYYLRRAANLAGSWLDQLNDEELELRLAYDRAAYLEFEEYEDEDTGETRRRRLVTAEQLGWTEAENDRRKARRRLGPTTGAAAPVLIPAAQFDAATPSERFDAAYYQHHRRVGRRRRGRR